MTTIAPGQLVLDTETQRIWRIVGPFANDPATGDWIIELVENPLGTRPVGDRSAVRENWLQRRCIDYSNAVDPPMGNGIQTISIIENGDLIDRRVFTSCGDAIEYVSETLAAIHSDTVSTVVHWSGWNAPPGAEPDMTVTLVDGELVWENASS